MAQRPNPLKLNKLQARTLVLAQVVARHPGGAVVNPESGDATLIQVPHAHGDHVHVGPYVVHARDASGFSNPAVWVALARKGLAHGPETGAVTLTKAGLEYDTGLGKNFMEESDH
ncbi:hypothetical protein HH303_07110 [Rhodospirillaceae bacterium KN72]|uniref:Uncharacterized protein n=1 Tax=Pacificispira spongiicola TaxID=2729598 RepID=A0A7Y0HE15_9PROT|nr:hypothetical protein [Pacificispira spongiicola]NMM44240.1 hypothetical protein [Pacificispira spongiicola]